MSTTYYTPLAIVIGFALVAGALYFTGLNDQSNTGRSVVSANTISPQRDSADRLMYGAAEAETTIIEFSDFECPFCAQLHPTIRRIVDESEGTINWEFRHLPLPSHRNAELAATAAECVAREVGQTAFWQYTDDIFANYREVSRTYLLEAAERYGLSSEAFAACEIDDTISQQIASDVATAQALGGNGTPFSVILFADGRTQPVSGALPYANWRALLSL